MNLRQPSMVRHAARLVLALWVGVLAGLVGTTPAGAQNLSDAQLRARFLLNFMRFTDWPAMVLPPGGQALELCVLALDDPFDGALLALNGEQAGGHRIAVRSHVTPEQAASCHVLYVPDSALRRVAAAREAIGSRPVLIVGESESILDRGGMIGLRDLDRHLSFVVNLGTARHAGLNFSPQMLHAAAEVLP